jgi:TonB family protein
MHRELIALLIETTVASSVALVVVLLLRRPMRHTFGARAAYALWALLPVALIAVLLPAPVQPMTIVPAIAAAGPLQAVSVADAVTALRWPLCLAMAWTLGASGMAALQLWQQRRFLRRLGPLRIHAHGLRVAAISRGLPAVTGVLRPRIVLPADFLARYDADERALVVAHERQHIARGDLPCNALVALLRCVYWFNPLLHWAVARYRHDQELACDARVLARHPRARRTYAQAMLKTQLDQFALPVGCHWHTHPIKERIAMLKRPSPRRWQTGLSSALLLALFAGGGYAAWAQQPAARPADESGRISSKGGIAKQLAVPARSQDKPATPDQGGARVEVRMPPPAYPKEAANAGITGRVVVIVDVAPDGSPAGVKIETSKPAGVFDAVVLKAVRAWKFAPATKHGRPIAGRVRVPIDFDIDPPGNASQAAVRKELANARQKPAMKDGHPVDGQLAIDLSEGLASADQERE